VNDKLTSIIRLFEIVDRCAKAEEGRLFLHNLPEALPLKPKSKDCKRRSRRGTRRQGNHQRGGQSS
jgi:hypothetical protein